jgi:thioredoxin reductase
MQRIEVAVVGGGPAGLSAAEWLGRYRRSTVVFDSGEYRNRWVEQVHAFLSRDPTTPAALLDQARTDLDKYDSVQVSEARVLAARKSNGLFELTTDVGGLEARRIILATGVEDVFPDLSGFFEHYGADVFHCPTCDGYEARGRDVAAIGWGAHVAGFALGLFDWARSVTVFTNGRPFEGGDADRDLLGRYGIGLVEQPVTELLGERGQLRALQLNGGSQCACQIAFFSIAHKPRTALAEQLGCELTEGGYVHVDYNGATQVPGVFAAGDLTPGQQLVSVAAANGAAAAVEAAESLRGEAVADRPGDAPDIEAVLSAARDE